MERAVLEELQMVVEMAVMTTVVEQVESDCHSHRIGCDGTIWALFLRLRREDFDEGLAKELLEVRVLHRLQCLLPLEDESFWSRAVRKSPGSLSSFQTSQIRSSLKYP